MSLNKSEKNIVIKEVAAEFAQAQTLVMSEYLGMKVDSLTQLRRKARDEGVYLRVIKNTLARRAADGTSFATSIDDMVGPLIYSVSKDPVAAAKVINEFSRLNDKLVIKSGNYGGKKLDVAAVKALANIPGREQLLAQLLGVMLSPMSAFARGLAVLAEQKTAQHAT